jgi:RHS repeat-associated protein
MRQRINFTLALALSFILGTGPFFTFAYGKNLTRLPASPKSDPLLPAPARTRRTPRKPLQDSIPLGQTTTPLLDGRLLLIGGVGPDGHFASSSISDPRNGESILLAEKSLERAWHSATMLPDGRVLIVGGIGASGKVMEETGTFDPEKLAFQELPKAGITPRAYHSATLLTDGQVLIVGGVSANGLRLSRAELWSCKTQKIRTAPGKLSAPRAKAKTILLSDGNVLIEAGFDENGKEIGNNELFNSEAESFNFTTMSSEQGSPETPFLTGSFPQNGATEVELDSIIGLRFSKPLMAESFKPEILTLTGEGKTINAKITLAEGGRLAFLLPVEALQKGTTYTVACSAGTDGANKVSPAVFSFTTAGDHKDETDQVSPNQSMNDVDWVPNSDNLRGNWRSKGERSSWQDQPPLQGTLGETALSGQVLTLRGQPLSSVTISVNGRQTRTDNSGRFLVSDITAGHQVMLIDGRSANRPGATYGIFRAGVDLTASQTNVLPYTIWMPKLDMAHAATISSPNQQEVVITNPLIPGLELHLPAGTVIRDLDGRAVTQISITPVPTDRPPFPLPPGFKVPVFASIQPGGARIIPPRARLIYPNYTNKPPRARVNFWNYDPEGKGWYVYGQGTVSANGKQIIPDQGVVIYEFTGIMIGDSGDPPTTRPCAGNGPGGEDGDPVDLSTGLFVQRKIDLAVADILPIMLRRTYRPEDNASRAFGIGATHPYDMFLWSVNNYQELDLILPDGGRIHYVRISPGTGFGDAVYEHTETPSAFYKSRISWNSATWELRLKDGTLYVFPEYQPLQSIRDRYGNQITIARTAGKITQITSPNGRWIQFTYDTSSRITQAKDNSGRTVNYTYDAGGRLWKVTDLAGGVTEYTYDTSNRMLRIKDPRNIVYLTNEYNSAGRVTKQTQADNSTYEFAYTLDTNGKITQTDVTDPRGNVRRVTFNSSGYILTDTHSLGSPEQQTVTIERQAGTNLVQAVVDPLGRRSEYVYNSMGNLTSITNLAGTSGAVTISFTYEANFNLVTGVTDPLNHTTSFSYDLRGNVISSTDPLNHQTTFTYNAGGQLLSVTSASNHTTHFAYDSGDLVEIHDPLGRTMRRLVDGAGRLASITNALGNVTRYEFDSLNRLTRVQNSLQGQTSFSYDANNNLLSTTDARGSVTSFTYDNMDRLLTRTDALQGVTSIESYEYDPGGNVSKFTDRRGKVTTFNYDSLNRRVFAGFGTTGSEETVVYETTVNYGYDLANRLTQAVDSQVGTIIRSYNDQARTFSETTPQGTVSYVLDARGRRKQMTVLGQQPIAYSYDSGDRVIGIEKGASVVSFAYDNANRRTSLTLPNGVSVEYGYDNASQLTSLTYKQGLSLLGDLTYNYDQAGRRTKMGGSFARTGQPQPVASATYNGANQLIQRAGQTLTYDANGNLTSDGVNTFSWDARNQLASITGNVSASFQYDAFGRRTNKSVNGNATNFLYDGAMVVQELSGTTPLASMLTGGIDQTFSRDDGDTPKSLLTDGLGSIIALTDSGGALTTQYTFEPFGQTTQTGSATSNLSQFTSRENDNTGLYFFRGRYYSPTIQRFISEDPVGLGGGDTNFYSYTGNDPINFTDPFGHQMIGVTGGVSGAAGAGSLSAGGTGSILTGFVFTDQGVRTGGAVGGGVFGFNSSDPASNNTYSFGEGAALGASAGVGGGLFISNATSFSQLGGDFTTIQFNSPIISVEYDVSGNTKVLSITAGKGWGGSIVGLKTNTPLTWEGPFHPVLPGAEPVLPLALTPSGPIPPMTPCLSPGWPQSLFLPLGGRK